jgi:tetratricopeptide (TPR) repeat protein
MLLKALEKDPLRRYATAGELAADLRRWIAGEAIVARPLRLPGRVWRWVRRHRLASGVAAAGLLAIAGLLTERYFTLAGERDRAEQARGLAEQRGQRAERVSEFLQDALSLANPDVAGGTSVPLRGPLDFASNRVETRLAGWPLEQAEVRQQLGVLYLGLGLYDEAERELRQAEELERDHAAEPGEIIETQHALGRAAHLRSRYDAARERYLAALRHLEGYARDNDALHGRLLNDLGWLEKDAGRIAEARQYYEAALALRQPRAADDPFALAETLNDLAHLHYAQREFAAAEPLFRQALDLRGRVHANHASSDVAATQASLGGVLRSLGRLAEADVLLSQALETRRTLLGEDHPATLVSLNELGLLRREQGRDAEAVGLLREVLTVRQARDPLHRDTAASTINLALALQATGELDEAEALCEQALAIWKHVYGDQPHANVAATLRHQAGVLRRLTRLEPAEAVARRAVEMARLTSGSDDSAAVALARITLAQVLLDANRPLDALAEAESAAAALQQAEAAPYWGAFADVLRGAALHAAGQGAEAEALLPEAVQRVRGELPEAHLVTRDAVGYLREWGSEVSEVTSDE